MVLETFAEAARLHERLTELDPAPLLAAADAMLAALSRGGKVLACGNGGSAADAQHFCAELVGRFQRERRALAALALTTDPSVVTSVANDYGFERVFARQIEALGRPGDLVLAISTSGESRNVIEAISTASGRGLQTIALTGRDGGRVGVAAAIHVNVPHDSVPRIQEAHRTILHVICDLVEQALADGGAGA